MGIRIISESGYLKSDWTGGTSTQFFIFPFDANLAKRDFLFRISSAKIDVEVSEFSNFEGYQRIFLPLSGTVTLQHEDRKPQILKVFETVLFNGGLITKSYGKCVDFNLIFRPELHAEVEVISLKKGEQFILNGDRFFDFQFLFAHIGEMESSDVKLKKGETVMIEPPVTTTEWTATEESTLLLSRISLKKD